MAIWGFAGVVNLQSALAVELHALNMGLRLLMQRNCPRVLVETDVSTVITLMHGSTDLLHPLGELICEGKRLHHLIWTAPITWVPCTCNMLVDGVAKLGHTMAYFPCFQFFDVCPPAMEGRFCFLRMM